MQLLSETICFSAIWIAFNAALQIITDYPEPYGFGVAKSFLRRPTTPILSAESTIRPI